MLSALTGFFVDFADFMNKVPVQVCNKRLVESLVKAGAFDSLGHGRRALVTVHESAVDQFADIKRNEAIGQDSLFADMAEDDAGFGISVVVPDIPDWDKQTRLAHEREMLGLYVSDHPLNGLEHVLTRAADCTIGELMADEERQYGPTVTVCGLVTAVSRRLTRKGDAWATVTLEDLHGAVEVLFFPAAYQLHATMLIEDTVLTVQGRISRDKEQPELHANAASTPDLADHAAGPVVITLPATRCTPPVVEQLKDVLRTHPGMTEVRLKLQARGSTTVLRLDDRLRVEPSSALSADLKHLLGPACLG